MKKVIAGEVVLTLFIMAVIFLWTEYREKKVQEYGEKMLRAAYEFRRAAEVTKADNRKILEEILSAVKNKSSDSNVTALSDCKTFVQKILDTKTAVAHGREVNKTAVNKIVENDYKKQQLMEEGTALYSREEYGKSAKLFNRILNNDPEDQHAAVYYWASVFRQNPGDESSFTGIKKNLMPLIGSKQLGREEEYTVLEVLAGISREQDNKADEERYGNLLKKMDGGN